MSFQSILFCEQRSVGEAADPPGEPDFFGDLQLDRVLSSITSGREQYELAPLFYRSLLRREEIVYRQQVVADLEQPSVGEAARGFAASMRRMRGHLDLAGRLHHPRQRQRWLLDAVLVYCAAVRSLHERLEKMDLGSDGFRGLREFLGAYLSSEALGSLAADAERAERALAEVTYSVHIRGNRVRVGPYEEQPDMSEEVEETFAKFRLGAAEEHRATFREAADMNHVEAQVLDLVARVHAEPFARLERFCQTHEDYLDVTVARFDREVQLYLGYLEYIEPMERHGLHFSLPEVSTESKEEQATATFDLALAAKLLDEGAQVVCNDFHLSGPERVLVVSGPNNGGKTTFARTLGQLHHLAALGLPVPGRGVRLFVPDRIFTHFEREEDIATLRGKFEDELVRVHDILEHATGESLLIMNESFGSTTLRDAVVVGGEVMRRIIELDALCVYVTFVDELASMGESTVSMMSTVQQDDPAVRTFKIVRKPADGLAYAAAIAEKYGLTYERLRRRIGA